MNEEIKQLKSEIESLKAWKRSLEMSSSIPLNIDQAFRARFLASSQTIATNSKSASSENQTVDEAGAATYSVLKPPDAFAATTIGTTTIYLPYYT